MDSHPPEDPPSISSRAQASEWEFDRPEVQHRLERTIRANRFTIAVVFPMVGGVVLILSAYGILPAPLAFNPGLILLGTLVMRSPLLVGLAPLFDRRAIAAIALLVGYTYVIEFIGVTTGYPYGHFQYEVTLGPMVQGVPLGLPLFFIPLVANAYLLTILIAPRLARYRRYRLPLALGLVMAIDLVLDPGAVALGFWTYLDGGVYYDVPISNYMGWVLSGLIAIGLLELAFDFSELLDRVAECEFILDDLISFIILWGGINLIFGHVTPVLIALGMLIGLLSTWRYIDVRRSIW